MLNKRVAFFESRIPSVVPSRQFWPKATQLSVPCSAVRCVPCGSFKNHRSGEIMRWIDRNHAGDHLHDMSEIETNFAMLDLDARPAQKEGVHQRHIEAQSFSNKANICLRDLAGSSCKKSHQPRRSFA